MTGAIRASCTHGLSRMPGTPSTPNTLCAITANSTGAVSTPPTATRRVRSAISARRSRAWSSSTCPAERSASASPGLLSMPPGLPAERSSCAASKASTTSTWPCSMFMPQANPNVPALCGTNWTIVVEYAGRAWLIRKSGSTTREEQSPASCRSNTSRTGIPLTTWMWSGLYPPWTRTVTTCTPSSTAARCERRGAKKNHSVPALTTKAASTTTTANVLNSTTTSQFQAIPPAGICNSTAGSVKNHRTYDEDPMKIASFDAMETGPCACGSGGQQRVITRMDTSPNRVPNRRPTWDASGVTFGIRWSGGVRRSR